jgi:hypothetical protein
MKKILLLIILVVAAVACHDAVRDKNVYRSELSFIRELNSQQVQALKAFVKKDCDCKELTQDCKKAVSTLLVSDTRMGWHLDMMAHNGGVGPQVSNPPAFPSILDYCKGL